MMETISLLDWVRKTPLPFGAIEAALTLTENPPFDWEALSSQLEAKLELSGFSIEPSRGERRPFEALTQGLGEDPWLLAFEIAPLPGRAFWLMSKGDLDKWLSWVWKEEPFLASPLLQEGFYRYMALECLETIQHLDALANYTLSLQEEIRLPEEGAFVIDLGLQLQNSCAWGRLILSLDLLSHWNEIQSSPPPRLSRERAQSLSLFASLTQGSFSLNSKELNSVKEGDVVLLDPPNTNYLTLGSIPLFQITIQDQKIRLTKYARIHQEKEPMGKKENSKDNDSESSVDETTLSAIKEVPLTITVELARLRLTLDELVHLEPGATLDLAIEPHQTVSLVLHGQKIGSGELVSLGEMVGVRILELGKTGIPRAV